MSYYGNETPSASGEEPAATGSAPADQDANDPLIQAEETDRDLGDGVFRRILG